MFAQNLVKPGSDKNSGFRCGFVGPITNEEREKLPYFGNNTYLMEVLQEKVGIEISSNYQKTVEEKGYIPFNIKNYEKIEPDSTKQTEGIAAQASGIDYDVVPVTVWVYRRDDGTGGTINQADVEAFFDEVSAIYEPTGIKVYMECNVIFENDTDYFTIDSQQEFLDMIEDNRAGSNLNVHLVDEITFNGGIDGIGSLPLAPSNQRYACAISINNTPVIGNEGNVIAHEIGHNLGLLHTHQVRYDSDRPTVQVNGDSYCHKCHQESVSRSKNQGLFCYRTGDNKCEVNGDMLCDTPADPFLQNAVDGNCNYNSNNLNNGISQNDQWGDAWQPSTTNVMSYSNYNCLTTFSASQVAIMYDNLSPSWSNSTTLNAPTSLCAGQTGNFYAPYSPASYQWVVPAGWTIVSGQGTRHATIKAGNNSGTVRAYPSCGNPRLDHYVSVTSSVLTVSGPNTLCSNEFATYTANYYSGASYNWSVNGMTLTSGQGSSTIYVTTGSNFSGAYITVSMTKGSCSGSGSKYISQNYNCGNYQAQDSTQTDSIKTEEPVVKKDLQAQGNTSLSVEVAYPNPANDELSIKLNIQDEYTIQLVDKMGNEVFSGTFITDKITLPVNRYPDGLYYLKVSHRDNSVVKRVFIKK